MFLHSCQISERKVRIECLYFRSQLGDHRCRVPNRSNVHSQRRSESLVKWSISKEPGRLGELLVFDVTGDPDDLQIFAMRIHPQSLADNVTSGRQTPSQRFIDNDYTRTRGQVPIIKVSPLNKSNAHGLEVIGTNHHVLQ